ncbi:cell division protein ZipA [Vitreoscilla massiliensis]|uniref:Cell division protein ZipA n=1 Tax=Vitreoscilla massiliensis TaxID=1689272 RepID=A0ABY4DXG2_9NEIS|nr:cell division protein ZipA C-terminal FtsZ-binding domain-containing protein [Vitreoscilla massiliensis]UOO87830.1 cell division protein ZipA [Vitreoscilla massiliensis]
MSDTTFYYIIGGLFAILAVLLFNSYKEKRYRDEVRRQFGHSDQDALLDSKREEVRDGQGVLNGGMMYHQHAQHSEAETVVATETATDFNTASRDEAAPVPDTDVVAAVVTPVMTAAPVFEIHEELTAPVAETAAVAEPAPKSIKDLAVPGIKNVLSAAAKNEGVLLLDLQDLTRMELPWFDNRVDYMAYVSLREPRELHTMPRLSNRHHFRVVGCTMDGRFQLAEPIPSVYYQGFVMGLQCISRKGLAVREDLTQFAEQVRQFAAQMGGGVAVANADAFMQVAEPMDELCVRVDQTIAIHLVSRESVTGREIKAALENLKFELDAGIFWYRDVHGKNLFNAVNLDSTPFIAAALDEQAYRGFSMLYDLTKVPAGEKTFNQFMDLVVKLSSNLGLDLVDDQLNELSTQWLKDIRSYVVERQDEMLSVDIEPGSDLAERLFS